MSDVEPERIDIGTRVVVTEDREYDLQNRAPAVVVDVDGDEATVVFEHTDVSVWRGISDDGFRRVVVDTLRRRNPDYFGEVVPTYTYPVERLRETLWHGWNPRWADGGTNGGESA